MKTCIHIGLISICTLLAACNSSDSKKESPVTDENNVVIEEPIIDSHSSESIPVYEKVFDSSIVKRIDISFTNEEWVDMQDEMTSIMGYEIGSTPDAPVVITEEIIQQGISICAEKNIKEPCRYENYGIDGECITFGTRENEILACVADGFIPDDLGLVNGTPSYFETTVDYEGDTWEHVGIRYRGNSSLANMWAAGKRKLPFNLSFDKFEDEYPDTKNQRFWGFKKLALINNAFDPSYIREKLVTDIFRESGVKAPAVAFYELYIDIGDGKDPKYFGLYTLNEKIEKVMLKEQIGNNDGNLYKPEGKGANLVEFDDETFVKKTNEENTDKSDLLPLFAAINADTTDSETWRANLEAIFEVDEFIRWMATTQTLEQWDSYGWFAHNYYLYHNETTGKFHWIPWDNNIGMETLKYPKKTLSFDNVGSDYPLLYKIMRDDVYNAKYHQYLENFFNGFFAEDTIKDRIKYEYNLIKPFVEAEETDYSTILIPGSFEDELDYLLNFVDTRRSQISEYLENPLSAEDLRNISDASQEDDQEDNQEENPDDNIENLAGMGLDTIFTKEELPATENATITASNRLFIASSNKIIEIVNDNEYAIELSDENCQFVGLTSSQSTLFAACATLDTSNPAFVMPTSSILYRIDTITGDVDSASLEGYGFFPNGLAIDSNNNLYITNTYDNIVPGKPAVMKISNIFSSDFKIEKSEWLSSVGLYPNGLQIVNEIAYISSGGELFSVEINNGVAGTLNPIITLEGEAVFDDMAINGNEIAISVVTLPAADEQVQSIYFIDINNSTIVGEYKFKNGIKPSSVTIDKSGITTNGQFYGDYIITDYFNGGIYRLFPGE